MSLLKHKSFCTRLSISEFQISQSGITGSNICTVYLTLTSLSSLKTTFHTWKRLACWFYFQVNVSKHLKLTSLIPSSSSPPLPSCHPAYQPLWLGQHHPIMLFYCPSTTPWAFITKVSMCPDLPRILQHMSTVLLKWLLVLLAWSKLFWVVQYIKWPHYPSSSLISVQPITKSYQLSLHPPSVPFPLPGSGTYHQTWMTTGF